MNENDERYLDKKKKKLKSEGWGRHSCQYRRKGSKVCEGEGCKCVVCFVVCLGSMHNW